MLFKNEAASAWWGLVCWKAGGWAVGCCGARLHGVVARQDPATTSSQRALLPRDIPSAAPDAGKETGAALPPRVQQLLLLSLSRLGLVLALNGGHNLCFCSSFEMHLLTIAGEWLEKACLTLKPNKV